MSDKQITAPIRRGSYASHEANFPESVSKLRERDPLAFDLAAVRLNLQMARAALLHVNEILAERHTYDPQGCIDCDDVRSQLMITEAM